MVSAWTARQKMFVWWNTGLTCCTSSSKASSKGEQTRSNFDAAQSNVREFDNNNTSLKKEKGRNMDSIVCECLLFYYEEEGIYIGFPRSLYVIVVLASCRLQKIVIQVGWWRPWTDRGYVRSLRMQKSAHTWRAGRQSVLHWNRT